MKKKTTDKNIKPEWELYPDISNTVSSNECTGLMQTVPGDENELLSYEDLYSMQKPKKYGNKK